MVSSSNSTKFILATIVRFIFAGSFLSFSSYMLFIKLDVIHVPGLIKYFPGAYALLLTIFILGMYMFVKTCLSLKNNKKIN